MSEDSEAVLEDCVLKTACPFDCKVSYMISLFIVWAFI